MFVQRPSPVGLAAREAILAGREPGALVGIPHPYHHDRRSLLLDPANEELIGLTDWIETRKSPWSGSSGRGACGLVAGRDERQVGDPARVGAEEVIRS